MKPVAVLDSRAVVAGIGWRRDARLVLRLLARRGFISIRSPYLTTEWTQAVSRLSTDPRWRNANWANWLDWLKRASVLIDNPHVRPTLRRDPKDDPVLASAVAARAKFLVSYDSDCLDLGKPYGVHCIRPREFIAAVLARP